MGKFTIGGKPVTDPDILAALDAVSKNERFHKFLNRNGDFSKEGLGEILDVFRPEENKIDGGDLTVHTILDRSGLTEKQFKKLAKVYHEQFRGGPKRVDTGLWSSQAEPILFEKPKKGSSEIKLGADQKTYIRRDVGVKTIVAEGLMTCVAVFVYDPNTKTTYAAHYSASGQSNEMNHWLQDMRNNGIPFSRLQVNIFYDVPHPATLSRLKAIEQLFTDQNIPYNKPHQLTGTINSVLFNLQDGTWSNETPF